MNTLPKPAGLSSRRTTTATVTGVGLASAAVLILEIALTRVFAVTQFYHFAFVTVSLALLGFGASGSVLAAVPRFGRGGPSRWAALAVAQSLATVGGYAIVNALPFDSFAIAWDPLQVVYLATIYLALAAPFFFGGAVVGVLLAGWDQRTPIPSNRIYAATLVGSGAGCIGALAGLAWLGGVGAIALSAMTAALAAVAFRLAAPSLARTGTMVIAGLAVLLAVWAVFPPSLLDLRLSPYKDLSSALRYPGAEAVATLWTAASRVDLIESEGIRSVPGLSYAYTGPLPPQSGLTFDGDDLSAVPLIGPEEAQFAGAVMTALPFSLRPGGEALILEPRGGTDVLVALASGAGRVTAVEPNEAAIAAASRVSGLYEHPSVEVVVEEPRVFIERTTQRFDVIDLALTAPYRPVTSGAYSLAEDYRLTAQAFDAYLARLAPNGVLAAMRWVQTPPSEEVRLVGLAAGALRRAGVAPEQSLVALRGYATALVLAVPDGFSDAELRRIFEFAEGGRFDVIAAPGLSAEAANRFNIVSDDQYFSLSAALIGATDPAAVDSDYPFDIGSPTDNRPFFSHFFEWSQAGDVVATLGRTWQPFGGAGYFVLLAFLALAVASAGLLILAPLAVRRLRRVSVRRGLRSWTVGYFGLLGIAFLFVEIPIFQQYILLLGRPVTSLAVVLFTLLVFSGLGSLAAPHLPWRAMAMTLAVTAAASPLALRWLTEALLPTPLVVRALIGGAALAPLGFLMGVMFPRGLALLEQHSPGLVPWAWGINGATSVVSGAAAALLALSFGFTLVVIAGGLCYLGAGLLAERARSARFSAAGASP